jgi:hypothetical protein
MDFHEQRTRDLARASSRSRAIELARRTRGILSRYVQARQAPPGATVTKILWGRILVAAALLALVAFAAARVVR